jgi:hypothetical protein
MTPSSTSTRSNSIDNKEEKTINPQEPAPKKKIGVWGPTHSYESDDSSCPEQILQNVSLNAATHDNNPGGTNVTKTSDSSCELASPPDEQIKIDSPKSPTALAFDRIIASASAVMESFMKSSAPSLTQTLAGRSSDSTGARTVSPSTQQDAASETPSAFDVFVEEVCSNPCSPRKVSFASPSQPYSYNEKKSEVVSGGVTDAQECAKQEAHSDSLGLISLKSPRKPPTTPPAEKEKARLGVSVDISDVEDDDDDSAFGVKTKVHEKAPKHEGVKNDTTPVDSLAIQKNYDISRTISELTMKSSYHDANVKMAECRRMAYYAVGKHHKNTGRGGNRRCYFTGKLILGGTPFYAGSVQQGLRTLVVFCLPSALGLPKDGPDRMIQRQKSDLTKRSRESLRGLGTLPRDGHDLHPLRQRSDLTKRNLDAQKGGIPLPREYLQPNSTLKRVPTRGSSTRSSSISKTTSLDEMSFLEEEIDPNWDLDRDYLLRVLPEPTQDLLDEMSVRYPEQFETLPVQVRAVSCWRLYVKFCFFSGLPIAEGEMHYKVKDEIAMEEYGEEIVLSHDVMEAVNGESAEILRLPNLRTFKYLRKHYMQQSGKLSDTVFQRTSWELVRPEV